MPGAPVAPTDARSLLPDDVEAPVTVKFAQSMRLTTDAPDLDSLILLGGKELSALDESVTAMISDR